MRRRCALMIMIVAGCEPAEDAAPQAQIVVQLPDAECATECAFDFGAMFIGDERFAAFDIINIGDAPTDITASILDSDPVFAVERAPASPIEAQSSTPVVVKARPVDTVDASGVLAVEAGAQLIAVALSSLGRSAALTVTPAECAFGEIPVGETRTCTVAFNNDDSRELSITSVDIAPAVFSFSGTLVVPSFIQPGSAMPIVFTATPTELGLVEGSFSYSSGATDFPNAVTFSVTGI